MPGLSAWAVRRPVLALIAWFVTVAAIGVLGIGFGGNYNDSFDLPDTESKAATDLLIETGPTPPSSRAAPPSCGNRQRARPVRGNGHHHRSDAAADG